MYTDERNDGNLDATLDLGSGIEDDGVPGIE
jgi:hypothetical protein